MLLSSLNYDAQSIYEKESKVFVLASVKKYDIFCLSVVPVDTTAILILVLISFFVSIIENW